MRKSSKMKTCEQKVEKINKFSSQAWSSLVAPGDTKRSKIEEQITKEKLRDRENAANPNTPWAPSGPERIYVNRSCLRQGSAPGP